MREGGPIGAIRLRLSAKDLGILLALPRDLAIARLNIAWVGMGDALDIIVTGKSLPAPGEGCEPCFVVMAFDEQYVPEFDENRQFVAWDEMLANHREGQS